jgi:hypothetical protein
VKAIGLYIGIATAACGIAVALQGIVLLHLEARTTALEQRCGHLVTLYANRNDMTTVQVCGP